MTAHLGPGATGMMWSASFLGAAGLGDSGYASPVEPEGEVSWRRYAGEASDMMARSTSERRTRQVRPARTAARRPVLIHTRTVAGWSFSSSLTCGTVSHGSSSGAGFGLSGIQRLQASLQRIDHLDVVDNS